MVDATVMFRSPAQGILAIVGRQSIEKARPESRRQVFGRSSARAAEALRAYQKAEADKWWPMIKAAGVKPLE
jgi:hypothetical protein